MDAANEIANLIFYLTYCATILMEIFFPCYFGTELMLKNSYLTTAAYSSNWSAFPIYIQKMIVIFMEFSKKPTILLSGKLFSLSLNSFLLVTISIRSMKRNCTIHCYDRTYFNLQVLNRTYSLFAVLRNLFK